MRPDTCFAMNTQSQFLADSIHVHLIAAKHVLRYLKGIVDYGLKYDANQNITLHGYVDLDWAGSATEIHTRPYEPYVNKLGELHA